MPTPRPAPTPRRTPTLKRTPTLPGTKGRWPPADAAPAAEPRMLGARPVAAFALDLALLLQAAHQRVPEFLRDGRVAAEASLRADVGGLDVRRRFCRFARRHLSLGALTVLARRRSKEISQGVDRIVGLGDLDA